MNEERQDDIRLVAVYRAPTENVAQIVRGLLESEGIEATFTPTQIPMYDGIAKLWEGFWGDILVDEDKADRARQIIEAYEPDKASDE